MYVPVQRYECVPINIQALPGKARTEFSQTNNFILYLGVIMNYF